MTKVMTRVFGAGLVAVLAFSSAAAQDGSDADDQRNAHDTHAINRWTHLPHDRQLLVLQSLGVSVPQAFYDCVCRSARYGTSITSQFYHPDTLGEFDLRYTCQHPGPPCIVSGYGCSRHDLPDNTALFEACAKADDLAGGNPLDNIIAALADRANRKGLTGNPVVMKVTPAKDTPPDCAGQRARAGGAYQQSFNSPVPPDRKIFALSPRMTQQLQDLKMPAVLLDTLKKTVVHALANSPDLIPVGDEKDLRLDLDFAEIGLSADENGDPFISEFVMKMPDGADASDWGGVGFEMAIAFEPSDDDTAIAGHQAKGYKFGFTYEGKVEVKYGVDIDPSRSASDYYDGEWQQESEYKVVRFIENSLADFDFYVGGAVDVVSLQVNGNKVSVGPEVTWKVKERFSNWVFSDMNASLDNLLDHQKMWEEKRSDMIRRDAAKFGVDARCFPTLTTIRLTRDAYQKRLASDPAVQPPFANLTGRKADSGSR